MRIERTPTEVTVHLTMDDAKSLAANFPDLEGIGPDVLDEIGTALWEMFSCGGCEEALDDQGECQNVECPESSKYEPPEVAD